MALYTKKMGQHFGENFRATAMIFFKVAHVAVNLAVDCRFAIVNRQFRIQTKLNQLQFGILILIFKLPFNSRNLSS